MACVPYRYKSSKRLRVGCSLISVGLCWKRFPLKPEAFRSPLAKNKVSFWSVCPTFWLTCGKITDDWGFLASKAVIPLSFHWEGFLSSLLCVCLERKSDFGSGKKLVLFHKQLSCCCIVCVSISVVPQRLFLLCFPLSRFLFLNIWSAWDWWFLSSVTCFGVQRGDLLKTIKPIQKPGF